MSKTFSTRDKRLSTLSIVLFCLPSFFFLYTCLFLFIMASLLFFCTHTHIHKTCSLHSDAQQEEDHSSFLVRYQSYSPSIFVFEATFRIVMRSQASIRIRLHPISSVVRRFHPSYSKNFFLFKYKIFVSE